MRQDHGNGYFLIQQRAVNLLWDTVDLEDRTMFGLVFAVVAHCEDAPENPPSWTVDGPRRECRRAANALNQTSSGDSGMLTSDRHKRYVLLQEHLIYLVRDAAELQDEPLVWLLKLLMHQCDKTMTDLLGISWNAVDQS